MFTRLRRGGRRVHSDPLGSFGRAQGAVGLSLIHSAVP